MNIKRLIWYRKPVDLIDYLLCWLITGGYVLDGLVGILTLGLCFGEFSYQASLLQARYRTGARNARRPD